MSSEEQQQQSSDELSRDEVSSLLLLFIAVIIIFSLEFSYFDDFKIYSVKVSVNSSQFLIVFTLSCYMSNEGIITFIFSLSLSLFR